MASLELKPEHGYVFLVAGALAVTHLVIGGIVSGARKAAFNKAYKERPEVKALEEEHKKAFPGQKFCPDGYPDMGSGKFSQLLPYEDWVKFNNAQRAHHNMLEQSASVYATLFSTAVFYPLTAAWLGGFFVVGRLVYAAGYVRGGPGGRMLGSLLSHVGDIGLLACTIRGGGKLAGIWS